MKKTLQLIILAAFFFTTAIAEDELDAALNKLKKKSQRRTYSTSAVLHNRDLAVPVGITAEEKSLDEKIRALDKKRDNNPTALDHRTFNPRAANPRLNQEKPSNWLTPALLDDKVAETGPMDLESSWITQELDRQKLIKLEKKAVEENTDLIHQQLRGESRPTEGAQYDQLQNYDSALQDILSGSVPKTHRTSPPATSLTPPIKTTFGVSSFSSIDRTTPTSQPGTFSSVIKSPQQITQFGRISPKNPAESKSIWDTPSTEPLSPIKRLRKRTLNTDPFAEDYMPKTKRSIWD